jgi:cell division protein FtsB
MSAPSASRGTRHRAVRRGARVVDLLLGMTLVAALVLGAAALAEPLGNHRDAAARVELLELQAAALAAENARLERRVTDLEDPLTIELLARQQQALVRPGDVPYVLLPPETDRPRIVEPTLAVPGAAEGPVDRFLTLIRRWLG